MDSFFEKLANSSIGVQSSEHLRLLGKRAAGMYMRKEAESLTDAVRLSVEGEDLSKEQVQRISEMANQASWQTMFHESDNPDVHFEPANADDVIGSMAAKPDVVYSDAGALDYYSDVPNQSVPADMDLAEAFGLKVDSPQYESINPTGEEQREVQKVASALDTARYGVDIVAGELAEAGETFYQMVKRAHLDDGLGLLQIAQAVGEAVQDRAYGVALMKQASARIGAEGVRFDEKGEMRKLAQLMVVNTDHPLMHQAAILEKLAYSYYSAEEELGTLRTRHSSATRTLRNKLRGI